MIFPPNGLPRVVLSDMDGLLLDTEKLSKQSFDHMAMTHGLTNADDIFPQLIGRNKAAHQIVFDQTLPQEINRQTFADDWMACYLELLADHVPVKDGALALMQRMQDHGIPFVVVTSSATAKAEMLLERAGLSGFIHNIIGGDQVVQGKPAPDIYLKAAAMFDHPIKTMLALEDSNNGIFAAYHSGAVAVQIPDLAPPSDDAKALGHIILDHLDDLAGHFGWPS